MIPGADIGMTAGGIERVDVEADNVLVLIYL